MSRRAMRANSSAADAIRASSSTARASARKWRPSCTTEQYARPTTPAAKSALLRRKPLARGPANLRTMTGNQAISLRCSLGEVTMRATLKTTFIAGAALCSLLAFSAAASAEDAKSRRADGPPMRSRAAAAARWDRLRRPPSRPSAPAIPIRSASRASSRSTPRAAPASASSTTSRMTSSIRRKSC